MKKVIGPGFGERPSDSRPLDSFLASGLPLAEDLATVIDELQDEHSKRNPTSALHPSLKPDQIPISPTTDDDTVHAAKHTPTTLDGHRGDFGRPFFNPKAPPASRPEELSAYPPNLQHALTDVVDSDRRILFSWHVSLNGTANIPWQSASAYHFLSPGEQGLLARQLLTTAPDTARPCTVLKNDIFATATQIYFGLEISSAVAQIEKGRNIIYSPIAKDFTTVDKFGLTPAATLGNTDSIAKSKHDAGQRAIAATLIDAGFMNVREDPDTRGAFENAVPAEMKNLFRNFSASPSNPSNLSSSRAGLHTRPDITATAPDTSSNPHTRETSSLLFDTKTLSHNKSYPASAEDLRKLLTRKLLSKNPETPPKANPSLRYSQPTLDKPIQAATKKCIADYDAAMRKMEDKYYPTADGSPATSTHFLSELERNGGIIPLVSGAYNETSKSVLQTIRRAAHLVADKAVRNGTTSDKRAAYSASQWFYAQTVGCALSKALAEQTLNAISFACSSRTAAKTTATNTGLKKGRASYFSRATADTEIPFRISAKRAFHNGRPMRDH